MEKNCGLKGKLIGGAVERIGLFLDIKSLLNARLVSRTWSMAFSFPSIWKNFLLKNCAKQDPIWTPLCHYLDLDTESNNNCNYLRACQELRSLCQVVESNWMKCNFNVRPLPSTDDCTDSMKFHVNNKHIAIGTDRGEIQIWNRRTLQLQQTLKQSLGNRGLLMEEMCVQMENNIVVSEAEGVITVWDIKKGRNPVHMLDHKGELCVNSLSFKNGLLLSSYYGSDAYKRDGSSFVVRRFKSLTDIQTEFSYKLPFVQSEITYVDFDGRFIVLVVSYPDGSDTNAYEIQVRSTATYELVTSNLFKNEGNSATWQMVFHYHDGYIVHGPTRLGLEILDAGSLKLKGVIPATYRMDFMSFNSKCLLESSDNVLNVWDFQLAIDPNMKNGRKQSPVSTRTDLPCHLNSDFQFDGIQIFGAPYESGNYGGRVVVLDFVSDGSCDVVNSGSEVLSGPEDDGPPPLVPDSDDDTENSDCLPALVPESDDEAEHDDRPRLVPENDDEVGNDDSYEDIDEEDEDEDESSFEDDDDDGEMDPVLEGLFRLRMARMLGDQRLYDDILDEVFDDFYERFFEGS